MKAGSSAGASRLASVIVEQLEQKLAWHDALVRLLRAAHAGSRAVVERIDRLRRVCAA
jgi:DNA invertase Pin-like site-specific DNA recombinase